MHNVKADIEEFIERYQLDGTVQEVGNLSDIFPSHSNRCYEVKLWQKDTFGTMKQQGVEPHHEYLYFYVGLGVLDVDLPDALRHLVDEAEHYGGWETFEEWNYQNDDGYFERQVGREGAEGFYKYCKECYHAFMKIIPDSYEELSDIVQGA